MVQKSKYNFSEIDAVYTPFIGGYWTLTIQLFLGLHLLVYCIQWICYLAIGDDVVGQVMSLNRGENFALWRIFTCGLVHNLIPVELLVSMAIVAFMGGDLERQWRFALFLLFYYLANTLSCALRYMAAPSAPVYGSLGGALAILCAFALRHPKRLVYGKLSVRVLAAFIIFEVLFFAWFCCTPLETLAYFVGFPFAFVAIWILPALAYRLSLWKLFQEAHNIYKVDMLKEQIDSILDKVAREGLSQLTRREKKYLKKVSELVKKHSEKSED